VQNTCVQIKSKEHAKNIDINKMIEEANQKYSKPKDDDARVQTFWQQLLIDCFPKEVRPSLATIRAKADKEKKEFMLICSKEQKDFLEENISLWGSYFLAKTHNYSITYVLPKPTQAQEPMPVSINNQISNFVNKFKL
jgi:phosphorylcholine metabolism protein LicD